MTVLQLTNLALAKLGVTKAATDVTTPGDTTYEYLANLTYDHDLRALLRRWPWPFATKYADLVLVQGPFWDTDPTELTLVQDWDSTATYAAGDVVREASINYYCILANSGVQPPNTTYWSTDEDDAPDYANPDWTYAYRYPSDCLFARRITEVAEGTQRRFDPTPIPFRVGRDENGLLIYTNEEDANLEYTMIDCEDMWSDDLFLDAFTWRLAAKLAPGLGRAEKTAQECLAAAELTIKVAATVAMNEGQQEAPGEAEWIRNR